MPDTEDRLKSLEEWRHLKDIEFALSSSQAENITKRLDKIDGHIGKLVWLIIAAIVGGFLTFVMRGGLNAGL